MQWGMRQVQKIKPTHAFPWGQGGSSLTNYLCSTIKYWPLAHIVSGQEAMKLIIFKTSPPCMCMGGWVLCCICPVTAVACHPHCHWPVILVVAPVIDVVVPLGVDDVASFIVLLPCWCAVGRSATECKPNKMATGVEELVKVSWFLPSITQTPKWIQVMQTVIHHCNEFPNNENMTGITGDDSRHLASA